MSKPMLRQYNRQFEFEMAAMTVSECRHWNPHMSKSEAAERITKAQAVVTKYGSRQTDQATLF